MRLSIAKHIRSLRKRAGLTQEELAQRLYVTRQTVSLWELGKTRPDVETLQAIADCLGVDLLQVLYGPEQTSPQSTTRRLIVWAAVSGGVGALPRGVMTLVHSWMGRPELIGSAWFVPVGSGYLWMGLYGCSLLALLSGMWLGKILNPVPTRPQPLWMGIGLAVLAIWTTYCVSLHIPLPWASLAAWRMQQAPWLFLPLGLLFHRSWLSWRHMFGLKQENAL